jgi:dimethylargininase
MIAVTRSPSEALTGCELTFVTRNPIDFTRAAAQHRAYNAALLSCGVAVEDLPAVADLPDAVFVEDTAVVLDELAILTRPASPTRQAEVALIEPVLRRGRAVAHLAPPATLEGGDVLRIGRTLFVGLSVRTNQAGIDSLRALVEPLDYQVVPVAVTGCLHLKTACTALDDETVLINAGWIDATPFQAFGQVPVDPAEPWGGNVLRVNAHLLMNQAFPRTLDRVAALGYDVIPLDISEFFKAEAGLTCMSLIVPV